MSWLLVGLAAVFVPMLFEQRRSRRHERGLRARGAVEPAADVYRWMAVSYPLAFALMALEGATRGAPGAPWLVAGGVVFVCAKALKYWAMSSLGERWTFRVLVPPAAPLVGGGPYRWVRHPNYVGVLGEFVGACSWFGAWLSGPLATVAFSALLWRRVRIEDRALRAGRPAAPGTAS